MTPAKLSPVFCIRLFVFCLLCLPAKAEFVPQPLPPLFSSAIHHGICKIKELGKQQFDPWVVHNGHIHTSPLVHKFLGFMVDPRLLNSEPNSQLPSLDGVLVGAVEEMKNDPSEQGAYDSYKHTDKKFTGIHALLLVLLIWWVGLVVALIVIFAVREWLLCWMAPDIKANVV